MPPAKPPKPMISCKVLHRNMKLLFRESCDLPEGQTIQSDVKAVTELLQKGQFPNFYKTDIENIIHEFSIPALSQDVLESLLGQLSVLYLIFVLSPHYAASFEKYLKQLSDITKAATKLRNLLNAAGNDFADFLSLMDIADPQQEGGDIPPRQFFYDLVTNLNMLIEAPAQISRTNTGKALSIGAKGRKPNVALYGWVRHLLAFWENGLGRSMQRDAKAISGRKQFLEFLDRCIEPLHPEIMLHNSDALDTMLKTIQADNKRGENRAIF